MIRLILCFAIAVLAGCMPSAGEVSNASEEELNKACAALSHVGYDYYELDVLASGGRILEVAADIHTSHTGPDATRKYCEERK